MNIKTIITVDGINVVDFGSSASRFYWVENLGSTTVYVSEHEDVVADGDNVKVLSAGCSTMIESLGGKIYILGAGKFQITNQGDKFPPFRNAPVADGGVMASGNPVQIDGLQGGVPFSEMVVSGKNLIGIAQAKVLEGNENSGYNVIDSPYSRTIIQKLQPNTTYTVKKYDSGNRFRIVLFNNEPSTAADITAKQLVINTNGSITEYTFTTDTANLWFAFTTHSAASGDAVEPIVQLEYGSTATAYAPPITGRELTVGVCGKNLIPYPYNRASGTYNGIELTVHDDGRFDISGTATTSFAILVFANSSLPIYLLGGQTYTISCNTPYDSSKFNLSARVYHTDGNYMPIVKFPTTFVAQEGEYLTSTLWIDSDVSVSAKNVELQFEYGDTATAYEPYHSSTTTITPTSNPYIIPNDIRQQDGLNVASVSEGEISVTGVRKNAAIKKIWDKIDELTTAIIVSNGETIE